MDLVAFGKVDGIVRFGLTRVIDRDVVTCLDEFGNVNDERGVKAVGADMVFLVERDGLSRLAVNGFEVDRRIDQGLGHCVFFDQGRRVDEVTRRVFDEADLRVGGIVGEIVAVLVARGEVERSDALVEVDPEGVVFA